MTALRIAAALALAAALSCARANAETHEASAPSSVRVETLPDGNLSWRAKNVQYVPYGIFEEVGGKALHHARLATITISLGARTDREGYDPKSSVSVVVDDLSAASPKRLASFSDPGTLGEVVGGTYFAATMPGCCAGPDIHHVRLLETGAALFRSTGPGAVGSAAWAEAPNAHPEMVRWAAFDGDKGDADYRKGLVGTISYGSKSGALSTVEIRMKPDRTDYDDMVTALSHDATLIWIDPKHPDENVPPSSVYPKSIWAIEGISDPAKVGGFQLGLFLEGKRLATIPVAGDRLVAASASAEEGISVVAAPR